MFIYLLTNQMNGKQYVGQTIKTVEARFKRHCWDSTTKNPRMPISLAIKKYGKENFVCETLEQCVSLDDLNDKEVHYIAKYNTLVPAGYNLSGGGGNNGPMHTSTREKISKANLGKKASEETKKKLSVAHTGYKQTDVTKQKLSKINKGKQLSSLARDNSVKASIKTYIVIDPSGRELTITNMAKFCRENSLSKSDMCEVVKRRQLNHKGWTVSPKDPNGARINFHSQETKDHLSAINNGKVRSEDSKTKQAKALLGRPLSEETKAKQSESLKATHQEKKARLDEKLSESTEVLYQEEKPDAQ